MTNHDSDTWIWAGVGAWGCFTDLARVTIAKGRLAVFSNCYPRWLSTMFAVKADCQNCQLAKTVAEDLPCRSPTSVSCLDI